MKRIFFNVVDKNSRLNYMHKWVIPDHQALRKMEPVYGQKRWDFKVSGQIRGHHRHLLNFNWHIARTGRFGPFGMWFPEDDIETNDFEIPDITPEHVPLAAMIFSGLDLKEEAKVLMPIDDKNWLNNRPLVYIVIDTQTFAKGLKTTVQDGFSRLRQVPPTDAIIQTGCIFCQFIMKKLLAME